MKRVFIIIVLAGMFIISAYSQRPPTDLNWELFWEDDFNPINTNIWNSLPCQFEKNHINVFTKRLDNVYTISHHLVLRAKRETYTCNGETRYYTGGIVAAKADYFVRYGYIEAKIIIPYIKGVKSSFWTFNTNPTGNGDAGEIDIFEVQGSAPSTIMGTNLWKYYCDCENYTCVSCSELYKQQCPDYNSSVLCYGQNVAIPSYANVSRTYAIEWSPAKFIWYVEGAAVRNFPNPGIHELVSTTLQLGVIKDPAPDETLPFPDQEMLIDYVRVYKLKFDCDTTVTEITNYDNPQLPNYYDYKVKKSISLSGISSLTSGQNVSLRATDYIELTDGFYVPSDAELYLDNNPCEVQTIKKKKGE